MKNIGKVMMTLAVVAMLVVATCACFVGCGQEETTTRLEAEYAKITDGRVDSKEDCVSNKFFVVGETEGGFGFEYTKPVVVQFDFNSTEECEAEIVICVMSANTFGNEFELTDVGGSENEYQPTVDCVVSGCDRFCLTSGSSVLLKTIDSTDDGDLVQVLRDINKRYYYTRAHSNLINGLTHESTVDNVTPWWKGVVIAIDVIVGLLLVGSAACFVIFGYIRPRNKTIT